MNNMEKMKILVAGCGSIGLRHLRCLALRADCRLLACDANSGVEKQIKEISPDIQFFDDYSKALATSPELVVVCTPNELHEKFATEAFDAGAHVLCEKPIAHTIESGERIVAAAKRADRILAVGYTERFRPAFKFIQEKVRSGEMGNLVGGRSVVGSYKTLMCAKSDFRSHCFGIILVDFTHELDMLHSIFGPVANVDCKGNSIACKEIPSLPSLVAMLLEYRTGAVVSIHFDYVQHPQRRIIDIYGDKQTLVYDMEVNTVTVFDSNSEESQVFSFPCERDSLFACEHENMIQAIRMGRAVMVNGEQALQSLAIAEEAINILSSNNNL